VDSGFTEEHVEDRGRVGLVKENLRKEGGNVKKSREVRGGG